MPETFTIYDKYYFTIYIICLVFSMMARGFNIPGLLYLRLILYCGFVTEVSIEILQYYKQDNNTPYYFYLTIEYCLLVLFYGKNTYNRILRNCMYGSIVFYLVSCLWLVIFKYDAEDIPASIYKISCALNVIWITILFLNIPYTTDVVITRYPLFWILTALLVFYAGTFFFNAAYSYFYEKNNEVAKAIRNYINNGLNFFLYLTLSYAFLCSWRMKEY